MKQKDIDAISEVHRLAFGEVEGAEIAQLAKDFLDHPNTISISADRDGKIAGNVLFTPFVFKDHPATNCYLLAPCGVSPDYQGLGVGKEIMETSIDHLKSIGADAVFVLGVPSFYPRYGFAQTDKQTPYPDLLTVPEAWMALELTPGIVERLNGQTMAIPQFMQSHWWDTSGRGLTTRLANTQTFDNQVECLVRGGCAALPQLVRPLGSGAEESFASPTQGRMVRKSVMDRPVDVIDQFAAQPKTSISIGPVWTGCRHSNLFRQAAANDQRMLKYLNFLLKTTKHLYVRNDCFRRSVETPPAAPPQGSDEPLSEFEVGRSNRRKGRTAGIGDICTFWESGSKGGPPETGCILVSLPVVYNRGSTEFCFSMVSAKGSG